MRKRTTEAGRDQEVYEEVVGELISSRIGYNVSRREREDLNKEESIFEYGEIGYLAIREIVEAGLELGSKGEYFIDLGSGMGKVVIGAAIAHNFKSCIGVEDLEGLFELSLELKKEFEATEQIPALLKSDISFFRGDLFTFDVSNADLIFCHTALFNEEDFDRLANVLASQLKPNAIVATVSYELPKAFGFCTLQHLILSLDGADGLVFLSTRKQDRPREKADEDISLHQHEVVGRMLSTTSKTNSKCRERYP